MIFSEGDLLANGAFCHTFSFFPICPPRSTFPTSNSFLCLQVRIVGGLFLSSKRYDSLFFHLLEINNRGKPPWISLFFSPFPDSYRHKSASIVANKLCKSVQDFTLGIDDASIALPPEFVFRAAPIYRLTLVVTTGKPIKQNLSALIGETPCVWALVDACVGRILSPGKFQFKARNEESLNSILHRGPGSYSDWMLTIHRRFPNITDEERKIILLWCRISGIPFPYLTNDMVRLFGFRIGPVTVVDIKENVNNTGFVRVKRDWNCSNPLRFRSNFQISDGEYTIISFHFVRIRNFCSKCGSLKHDIKECPLIPEMYSDQRKDSYSLLPWQQRWVIKQKRLPTDQCESFPALSNVLISTKRQDTVLSPTTSSSHFKSKVMLKAFWSLSSKLIANNKYVKEGHNRFHLLARKAFDSRVTLHSFIEIVSISYICVQWLFCIYSVPCKLL